MRTALKLAERGLGRVEPNPAVGCVIARQTEVIGKGYHRAYGGPHAEIEALADCGNHRRKPQGATAYVTLEPCRHFGKTPPCTEALISAGIARVVVAAVDPSSQARGAGIDRLKAAGIRVDLGACEAEAIHLNRPFFKHASTGTPWVTVKWAQSLDGGIAWAKGRERWISSEASRLDAHNLRRRVQAILVGINTVLADDPMLTARPPGRTQPLRVVLDTDLRISMRSRLLTTLDQAPTLVVCGRRAIRMNRRKASEIVARGGRVLALPSRRGRVQIHSLLLTLGRQGVRHLLVEGGPTIIGEFLVKCPVDEVIVYVAPLVMGSQGVFATRPSRPALLRLSKVTCKRLDGDLRLTATPTAASSS